MSRNLEQITAKMLRDVEGSDKGVVSTREHTTKMPAFSVLPRSAVLLTGVLALWGLAAAQTPTQGGVATNSAPSAVALPASVPVANQPPQAPPADDSIDSLRRQAEAGDARAQFILGLDYSDGTGVEKDDVQAAQWYRKAAEQGNAPAQRHLGFCYYNGTGVEKDVVESAKWYRKAADQGDAGAQFILGLDYLDGSGVEKDAGESATWFRKAAEQGNAQAQCNLAIRYDRGDGVTKDASEAAKWYRKAAEQGNAHAQFNLGVMYANGEGVTKDTSEALNWYRKAADQGYTDAQFNLGHMYAHGEGVTKDASEALNWYRKAALQGDAGAQFNLGHIYANGEGVTQDYIESLAWFIVSSSSGLEEAIKQRDLGERIVGVQSTLLAQQRSKEISNTIEQSKAQASRGKEASNRGLGDLPKSSGTGVFVSRDGLFITAAHVVKNALAIKVLTQQGLKSAQVIQIDTSNDVALLKCEGQFQAAPIKSSSAVELGQSVFTIGFPDIQLQGFSPKMTQGEISSLSGIQDDPRDWQISVPVQPGNSGGPLFDAYGNVVGLVVAKLDAVVTAQATGALPEDVNYAVKTAYILPLLDPYTAKLLPDAPTTADPVKTEDVVGRVQNSVVLILVY